MLVAMLWKIDSLRKDLWDIWAAILVSILMFCAPQLRGQTASGSGEPPPPTAMTAQEIPGGARFQNNREAVEVVFCGEGVAHITARPLPVSSFKVTEPWIAEPCAPTKNATFQQSDKSAEIKDSQLTVSMELASGALQMRDAAGKVLLREAGSSFRRFTPANVPGQQLYKVSERFYPEMQEGLYGLGQHQNGVFNYRGTVIELAQRNSDIAIPLLLSSNGYGIFWNTASRSTFDNRFARELDLSTAATPGIDFYFFYGPEMDTIIHHYRELTGHAPLFGEWAYGFVQSKDRYTSAQQLLDIAGSYRAQHIPLDLIVQDWFWWKTQGDPEFTAEYMHSHASMPEVLDALHKEHIHAMISVWAVLNPKSNTYRAMLDQHLLVPGTPDYDATNPKAREFYWNNLIGKVFAQGWDGFWLDSSEPETWGGESDGSLEGRELAIGPGDLYGNIFPLMHTGNVYEHWRKETDQKRAILLTRSAFAGQQRNATVEWSGDIFSTFYTLKKQVAAGLNFAISGMPYWTTDVGGYFSPYGDDSAKNPDFQELYTRWFEYGTFCPILRTHGHRNVNELYEYGPQASTLIAYDKLRYRLLPYTYSLAWKVTHEDYTIQRPLVMDWRADEKARAIGDQFMFGPSILVNPVTDAGATSRFVYLPQAAAWYDFWTSEKLNGSQTILAQAPLPRIPLYVRAGAILPFGPEREYAGQNPDAPIEIRIYPGADGSFDLYQDQGDTYAYEKGEHAEIPMHWDDATRTLTIDARKGSYPGMPGNLSFHVVIAGPGQAAGMEPSSQFKEVSYSGSEVSVKL